MNNGAAGKTGWPSRKLGDLSELITKGTTPTSVGHAFVPEGINFVKVESISENGQFIENKLARITQSCHHVLNRSQLKFGDILFSIAGALGRTAFVTEEILPANINQALAIIRLRKSAEVFPEFVLKALATGTVLEQIQKFRGGVAQQNLSLAQVQEFTIPLPPLPEQKRIVGILDEAFDGIATAKANAEKNLQNARALFERHLQSVFTQRGDGWVEKTLGDVCHKITDGTHATPNYTKSGVPFLSVKDLTKGFIDFSDTRFISVEEHQALTKRCKPTKNDILYTKVGTTGVAQVVDVDEEFSIFVSVALLKIKHEIIYNWYLEHFLNAPYAREQARQRTRGMANKNLVITDIKEIVVHFPRSLDQQRSLVTSLDALHAQTQRLESVYRQKLAALDALKKSLLDQAFTGVL